MSTRDSTAKELQRSLTRLHSQLSASPSLNDDSRRLLREVLGDIERLLGDQATAVQASAPVAAEDTSRSRLEALAATFDAGHPRLSASVRELVDLLGRAGL